MTYKFITLFASLLFVFNIYGQEKTVTGKIISSEDKMGIPGTTVISKGPSKTHTMTDIDGNYKISVTSEDTLEFSSSGMLKQSVPVGKSTVINVTLSPEKINLKEMVVIGYGTLKKSNVSSSIASMKPEDIKNMPVYGIDQAMQGRLPGVEVSSTSSSPGAPLSVRIRGIGTIGNSDPLYVVDGLIISASDVNGINPGDVERIDVLKDASAAAIYGTRGANGVVLITTKKGSSTDGKNIITFDTYYGMQNATHLPSLTNAQQYMGIQNTRLEAQGFPQKYSQSVMDSIGKGTNWWKDVTRPAPVQSYQLSAMGGTAHGSYLVSGSYYNQDGIMKNTYYNRITLRVNTEQKFLHDWVTVGENLTIANSNRESMADNSEFDGEWMISAMSPTVAPYNAHPDPYYTLTYGTNKWSPDNTGNNIPNPVGVEERRNNNATELPIIGNGFVKLSPLKGLDITSTVGVNIKNTEGLEFDPRYYESPTSLSLLNTVTRTMGKYVSRDWTNTASYAKTIDKHDFRALFGVEEGQSYGYSVTNILNGVPDDKNFWYAENAQTVSTLIYNYPYQSRSQSYFGRLDYTFDNKYIFQFNLRRDGSTNFGPSDRFGNFPSFSLGWNLMNEKFMKDIKFISTLKLRGGWGKLGNDQIAAFAYLPTVVSKYDNYTFGATPALSNGMASWGPSNPNLHWESTTTTNIATDVAFLKNKILFTAEAFNRYTSDMLVNMPVSGIVGAVTPPVVNAASMTNKGVEFDLNYRKSEGQFHYSAGGNISFVKNNVDNLGAGVSPIQSSYSENLGDYIQRTSAGYPVASFYGYKTDGIFQNWQQVNASGQTGAKPGDIRFKDLDGDGKITSNDMTYLGSPLPKFTYGINGTIDYKGFDVVVYFQGVSGNKIFNFTRFYTDNPNSGYNLSTRMLDAWTPENTNTNVPALGGSSQNITMISDYYLENGSYFRCKNIQLGYTLPKSITEKLKIVKLRVYVSVQNLFTITKYSGADPELGAVSQNNSTQQLTMGVDYGNYPVSRTVLGGINLTF